MPRLSKVICCANCQYYEPDTNHKANVRKGLCKVDPPKAFVVPTRVQLNGGGSDAQIASSYAPTPETEWCGKFAPVTSRHLEISAEINHTVQELLQAQGVPVNQTVKAETSDEKANVIVTN